MLRPCRGPKTIKCLRSDSEDPSLIGRSAGPRADAGRAAGAGTAHRLGRPTCGRAAGHGTNGVIGAPRRRHAGTGPGLQFAGIGGPSEGSREDDSDDSDWQNCSTGLAHHPGGLTWERHTSSLEEAARYSAEAAARPGPPPYPACHHTLRSLPAPCQARHPTRPAIPPCRACPPPARPAAPPLHPASHPTLPAPTFPAWAFPDCHAKFNSHDCVASVATRQCPLRPPATAGTLQPDQRGI